MMHYSIVWAHIVGYNNGLCLIYGFVLKRNFAAKQIFRYIVHHAKITSVLVLLV